MHPSHSFTQHLETLAAQRDLSFDQASLAMNTMMAGEVSDIEIAGFLMALQTKGATSTELAAFVRTMREHMHTIDTPHTVVDPVGTGGDMVGTINISTIASVVAAGAGVHIGKHGNRSVSSKCGSADLVAQWGVPLDLNAEQIAQCIDEAGIALCFAPMFHPAVRHVMPARNGLRVPTIFNVLGPLANPIGNVHQTVGVAFPKLAPLMAQTLAELGAPSSLVFLGADGLDEITVSGTTHIWEIREGAIHEYDFDPQDYGMTYAPLTALLGGDPVHNAGVAQRILEGERGPMRDAVVLAAAATLMVSHEGCTWGDAIAMAQTSLDSAKALEARDAWVRIAQAIRHNHA